jgi:hypothetical protein
MLEILIPQYEMAKVDEAKEDISFQVIDKAAPPIKKAKPNNDLNALPGGRVFLHRTNRKDMEYVPQGCLQRFDLLRTYRCYHGTMVLRLQPQ